MSTAGLIARNRRRILDSFRNGRALQVGAAALLLLAAVLISAILEGDLPELLHTGLRGMRDFLAAHTFLAGFGLLYIEESGIPLPAPGDVFVLYVGAHIPRNLGAWMAAWLGLVLAVTLGATNLFFLSRRFGQQLVQSRFAEYVHLSPERLARAEKWFARYGMLAIIFGRHIPGFRVPITVAAGTFKVQYRVFVVGVAISTAIWAGVVLIIGINFGPRIQHFLGLHSWMYVAWGFIVLGVIGLQVARQRRRGAGREDGGGGSGGASVAEAARR